MLTSLSTLVPRLSICRTRIEAIGRCLFVATVMVRAGGGCGSASPPVTPAAPTSVTASSTSTSTSTSTLTSASVPGSCPVRDAFDELTAVASVIQVAGRGGAAISDLRRRAGQLRDDLGGVDPDLGPALDVWLESFISFRQRSYPGGSEAELSAVSRVERAAAVFADPAFSAAGDRIDRAIAAQCGGG